MPYLISYSCWPSDKTSEVVKKVIEANKKFPWDESLGEEIVPNAIKATKDGTKSMSVTLVNKGKLEEAFFYAQSTGNFYAMSIEGFEYTLEIRSTAEEAYASIGQKPPE